MKSLFPCFACWVEGKLQAAISLLHQLDRNLNHRYFLVCQARGNFNIDKIESILMLAIINIRMKLSMKDVPLSVTEKAVVIDSLRSQITHCKEILLDNPLLAASQMESMLPSVRMQLPWSEQISFLINYGRCLNKIGRFTVSLDVLSEALELRKKHRVHDISIATILNDIGDNLLGQNRAGEASEYLQQASRLIKRSGSQTGLFRLLMSKARCHSELFEYSKALDDLFTAESIALNGGSDHDKYLVYIGLGNVYAACYSLEKAVSYYELSAQYANKLENKIYYATSCSNLCKIYTMNAELDKALELSLDVLAIYERYNYTHYLAVMNMNIGIILNDLNRHGEALEYILKAQTYFNPEENPVVQISIYLNLADAYFGLGDSAQALKILDQALSMAEAVPGHELLLPIHQIYCKIYSAKKQWKKVLEHQIAATDARLEIESYNKEAQIQKIEHEFKLKQQKHESEIYRLKNVELKKKNKQINQHKVQLEKALHDLQLALDNKTKLFSIVAHDLRAPLSSLYQGIELAMTSEIPPQEKDEFMAELHKSAFHVYSLTDNLLRWAGRQLNAIVNNPKPIDIVPLLKISIQQHQLLISAKHIKLEQHIEAVQPALVDPGLWSVVLRNLLSNAIKFTPNDGTIRISIIAEESFYRCTIMDSGKGMNPEDLLHLFDSGPSNTTKVPHSDSGIGLGLVLVKEFVEMMGGTILVESTLGLGSSFSFTFPMVQ